jgi:DnaJ domain
MNCCLSCLYEYGYFFFHRHSRSMELHIRLMLTQQFIDGCSPKYFGFYWAHTGDKMRLKIKCRETKMPGETMVLDQAIDFDIFFDARVLRHPYLFKKKEYFEIASNGVKLNYVLVFSLVKKTRVFKKKEMKIPFLEYTTSDHESEHEADIEADKDTKDYHKVLGVSLHASKKEIKKSYMRLILLNHPDKNIHRVKEATSRSQEIIEAFNFLMKK